MTGPLVTKSGPSAIREDLDYYEAGPELDVFSWSPDPEPGRSPATQVHLHFCVGEAARFVVRFKGPGTLDALIAALVEHREHVWGKP